MFFAECMYDGILTRGNIFGKKKEPTHHFGRFLKTRHLSFANSHKRIPAHQTIVGRVREGESARITQTREREREHI